MKKARVLLLPPFWHPPCFGITSRSDALTLFSFIHFYELSTLHHSFFVSYGQSWSSSLQSHLESGIKKTCSVISACSRFSLLCIHSFIKYLPMVSQCGEKAGFWYFDISKSQSQTWTWLERRVLETSSQVPLDMHGPSVGLHLGD